MLPQKKKKPRKLGSVLARYPELRRAFLKHLARFGSIAGAASYVRLSRAQVEDWAKQVPEFACEMEDALDEHRGKIEQAIYERAVEGVQEPKFNAQGVVGYTTKYSDQLLLAYAKRHIREYREGDINRTEVVGQVDHRHAVDLKELSGDQRQALRLLLGEGDKENRPRITLDSKEAETQE